MTERHLSTRLSDESSNSGTLPARCYTMRVLPYETVLGRTLMTSRDEVASALSTIGERYQAAAVSGRAGVPTWAARA